MAHVLNLAVQCCLKELGNDESYSDSEDDDRHIEGLEAISHKPFDEIFHRLRKGLITLLRGLITIIICVMSWECEIKILLLRMSEPGGIRHLT